MKIKQRLDDFSVEEVSRLEPGVAGPFALYRLAKSGIGTPEAMRVVARAWRLGRRDVAFAGLKDRYGVTGQVVSVRRGPRRNFDGKGFRLNYLGCGERPAGRGTILKNRFRIVVRDLEEPEAERVLARAAAAARDGFPDFYDDQRFGSVRGTGGAFVARALLDGDDEEALRLAIASPARKDRSRLKARRKRLRDEWGAWDQLAGGLEPSLEKRICARLAAGASFKEAYELLDRSLRSIHLAAFQAHLFNECLRRAVPAGPEHPGLAGPYRFYEGDPGALREEKIPLASGRAPAHPRLDEVLAGAGLERARLADFPFRAGARGAIVSPEGLETAGPEPDELNPGRVCVELAFALRPGSYGTMLVKRCTYDMR